MEVKDSNGTSLKNGDNVILIKSMKIKGAQMTLKSGTLFRNIKLKETPEEVDCSINGTAIVLSTIFLRKAD
ncbi:MAG: alkylphosphonate utilization protein [Bacteroidetes bacterium]|nr:alkylphosphonate utilization protein [Bacteroidota bacterium]